MKKGVVSGSFDVMLASQMRLIEEAAKSGPVSAILWTDALVERLTGRPARFPLEERLYFLQAVRYVEDVQVCAELSDADSLPEDIWGGANPLEWVVDEASHTQAKLAFCAANEIGYRVVLESDLRALPASNPLDTPASSNRKKALVTGCFDWLHSGHVRFFEEVSGLGDVYVVVGSDANVRLLKGAGHPQFSQDERRYMVGAIRHVTQALISTGQGWMDSAPEIERLQPELYVVNEDGDQPEKRRFCADIHIEYVVLKRLPRPGLQRRESTTLRGF